MNRLTDIRLHAQQLVAPQFDDPAELIRWMGMVQAQEYSSAKWAVALRLRTPAAAGSAFRASGSACINAGPVQDTRTSSRLPVRSCGRVVGGARVAEGRSVGEPR